MLLCFVVTFFTIVLAVAGMLCDVDTKIVVSIRVTFKRLLL